MDSRNGARRLLAAGGLSLALALTACQAASTSSGSGSVSPGAGTSGAPVKPTRVATTPGGGTVGAPAFDFEARDASGKTVRLSDFRGKIVVLDFWATWCPPCRREIPGFVALQAKYASKGVEVVGVSLDQDWKPVVPFVAQFKINYTIVLGDQALTQQYGGFTGIPTTFVIDREGVIRDRHEGYAPESVFVEAVERLL